MSHKQAKRARKQVRLLRDFYGSPLSDDRAYVEVQHNKTRHIPLGHLLPNGLPATVEVPVRPTLRLKPGTLRHHLQRLKAARRAGLLA